MAEGYLKHFIKKMNIDINIYSAGVKADGVNPKAISTMLEDNIDISDHTSNKIEEFLHKNISHVITVCDHANENCPVYLKRCNAVHHNFTDPSKIIGDKNTIDLAYEKCREEIKAFTLDYLKTNFNSNA
jgi:arsenate reductase